MQLESPKKNTTCPSESASKGEVGGCGKRAAEEVREEGPTCSRSLESTGWGCEGQRAPQGSAVRSTGQRSLHQRAVGHQEGRPHLQKAEGLVLDSGIFVTGL